MENNIKYIDGDLIKLAQNGHFDVIVHGCNCFCTQGAGIAKQMAKYFQTNDSSKYNLESESDKGNHDKLGNIQSYSWYVEQENGKKRRLDVVNAYTQYHYGKKFGVPFDYDAFALICKKLNQRYKENKYYKARTIGMPKIGAGLAGGDWDRIEKIIEDNMKDVNVVVVMYSNP